MVDLVAEVERIVGLSVGESTLTYQSVTGTPYVTLDCGGVKEEGKPHLAYGGTEEMAEKLYLNAVKEYASGKTGSLFWRTKPTVRKIKLFEEGFLYTVHSRLLIEDTGSARSLRAS